jgi:four helix bundle protein
MRRSASSVGANIAEGCGRHGDGEMSRFLQIALGSASELEYHLLLAHDLELLKYVDYQRLNASTTEVKRMLSALVRKLRADSRELKASS